MTMRTHAIAPSAVKTAKALLAPLLAASLLAYPLFQAFAAQSETGGGGTWGDGPGVTVTQGGSATEGAAPTADGSATAGEEADAPEDGSADEGVAEAAATDANGTTGAGETTGADAGAWDAGLPAPDAGDATDPAATMDPPAAAGADAAAPDEAPHGPDTTMALETGVPMAGGESANPMDALLETVARQQGEGSHIEVAFADEGTGRVSYA